MNSQKDVTQNPKAIFYRFQVFVKDSNSNKRTIGAAYLQEGQTIYTLRIWTLLSEKFFLLPSKEDPTKYLIMTREPNNSQLTTNKYFWNIVGSAKANAAQSVLELNFDIFEKILFVSIFPETSSSSKRMSDPVA